MSAALPTWTSSVDPLVFTAAQESGLDALVASLEDDTEVLAINNAGAITLSSDGKLPNELTFSQAAFSQLCAEICPGLASLMTSLSVVDDRNPGMPLDTPLAAKIFNRLAAMRFDSCVRDHQLVVNKPANRVDGVVGPSYQRVPHDLFMELVRTILSATGDDWKFNGGIVLGRRLSVSYKLAEPFTTKPEVYYAGCYCSNSDAGDSSLWASFTLFRGNTEEMLLESGPEQRCLHAGRNLYTRARQLLQRATRPGGDRRELRQRLIELDKQSLGIETDRLLVPLTFSNTAAKLELLWNKLGAAGTGAGSRTRQFIRSAPEDPTQYAVLRWLLSDAQQQPITAKERIGRMAWKLLMSAILPTIV